MPKSGPAKALFVVWRIIRRQQKSALFSILLPLFITAYVCPQAPADGAAPTSPKAVCVVSEPPIEGPTDIQDLNEYSSKIASLLTQERFDDLDCIADQARKDKTRLPGGTWKLVAIYTALEAPAGHATEQDWKDHLAPLEHWVTAKPGSITARIALANSYVSYAWDARGNSDSETVTDNGWRLLSERLNKAKEILDEASVLPEKCPEWYLVMQNIAQGLGWDIQQDTSLFQQAIAFEPEYYSYYRVQAVLLLPKWYGEQGEAAAFASSIANTVGGRKGDILYFQIAAKLACACNDPELKAMSWERIQKGFADTEETYGTSMTNLNSFALMAVNFDDYVVADSTFRRIGDNWDKHVWRTEVWFKQNRDTATQFAPVQARNREARKEAEANMKSAAGPAYRKQVEHNLRAFGQACLKETKGNVGKFEIFLRVGEHGSAEDARGENAPDSFGLCMLRALYVSSATKQTPFPPPPYASYWVPVELDPAAFPVSAK